jgi:hypothetical protein
MGIVDTVKELTSLAQKVQNIELFKKLVSFQSDISALQEENYNLKETVRNIREKIKLKGKIVYEKPFYWIKEDDKKDGPYCQKCYDSNDKRIHLQDEGNDTWRCLNCQSYFRGPNYVSRPISMPPCSPMGV